jgi:hypothetical protein
MTPRWRIVGAVALSVLAASLLAPPSASANGCITSGAGTAQDPFIIADHVNLDCIRIDPSYYWNHGYHFKQTADIDMSSYLWTTAIGDGTIPFRGVYDGDGHTITGLTVGLTSSEPAGLFGLIYQSTISDVTLVDISVSGTARAGGLVGTSSSGVIEDVAVHGSVSGSAGVGGIVGWADDGGNTTVRRSFSTGTVSATTVAAGGLVGLMATGSGALTIADSFSAASVSGPHQVGGLLGTDVQYSGLEQLVMTDSYARGTVQSTQSLPDIGGVIGCIYDDTVQYDCISTPLSPITVTESYWDIQTTGTAISAGSFGSGLTTAQMTSAATFTGWSIAPQAPAQTTWGICPSANGGYPFLQWYAAQQGWTCTSTPPTPPAPVPASAPRDVVAVPSDRSAVVTWQPPASTGSYPVSTYIATASPGGRTCLAQTTSCEVTGLTNGTAYVFTVAALTGAGWSSPSAPSPAVTPSAREQIAIVISGSRSAREISIHGTATGIGMGAIVTPWARKSGGNYQAGRDVLVSADGTFTWSRKVKGAASWSVYVAAGNARSNTVVLRAR